MKLSVLFKPSLKSRSYYLTMNLDVLHACRDRPWLMQLCRWLPVAVGTMVLAAWLLGYALSTLAVPALLLICLIVCVLLYILSKETEGQIGVAVAGHERRKDS